MTASLRSIRPLSRDSLRGIEPASSIGKMPKVELVDPRSLYVEDDYQRDMAGERSMRLIRNIIANFNWTRFKPPICVRLPESGNVLVCIDGQHSATAAASHPGVSKIPVLVVSAADLEHRALAFVGHNRERLNLTQGAIFKAEIAAGDPVALAADRAAQAAGAHISTSSISLKDKHPVGTTIAVGTIRALTKARGEEALRIVLQVLVKAGRGPIKADEIAAVALITAERPDIADTLSAVIASKSAEKWRGLAASAAADSGVAIPAELASIWLRSMGMRLAGKAIKSAAKSSAKMVVEQKPKAIAPIKPVAPETIEPPPTQPLMAPTVTPSQPQETPSKSSGPDPIERDGVCVRKGRLIRAGVEVSLSPPETGAMAILVKVMPAVLPYDRIALKAFGHVGENPAYEVKRLAENLAPKLQQLGLALREVTKMGFALSDA